MNARLPVPADAHSTKNDLPIPKGGSAFRVVGVGASAGGLEALTQLLGALPADAGLAVVIVQHLAPGHASSLTEILSRSTPLKVCEVSADCGEPEVEVDHVYVIPPGQDMVIAGGCLRLRPQERLPSPRGIDLFFRSLAADCGNMAVGVVLSGAMHDGTIGLEAIKAAGGTTFAQDDSAVHDSMPRSAVASGCVDFVLGPVEIAGELVRIARHASVPAEEESGGEKSDFAGIVQILHEATGVDFTQYKANTLRRRITRRMELHKPDTGTAYEARLRAEPAEVEALFQDILINVTSFFRDPGAFEALARLVFPRLVKDRAPGDTVRVWTPGCSTGEEAYSLAMAYAEYAASSGSGVLLQIFATDLNAKVVARARTGVYSKSEVQDVSAARMERFFTVVEGGYRISKAIRDRCVFSRHNVLADPPFSRVDLVACRNLLIYLEPVLQQKVMPLLHYALKPGGCLWLGSSETTGASQALFDVLDARNKIFVRRASGTPSNTSPPHSRRSGLADPFPKIMQAPLKSSQPDLQKEAERLLLANYTPPGVLISPGLEILQYRGDTGPYLAPAAGAASLHLLKMLRDGLLVGVRAAVLRAGAERRTIREAGLRVKSENQAGFREVVVEVVPVLGGADGEGGFLVLFKEPPASAVGAAGGDAGGSRQAEPGGVEAVEVARLTQELAATHEYLQTVIRQHEAASEELQQANEEGQSANEEMQSVNEELETSKEEIQSSNEELVTVNGELNNRNVELNQLNAFLHQARDYAESIIASLRGPLVVLDAGLRVETASEAFYSTFHVAPAATLGRRIYELGNGQWNIPALRTLLEELLPQKEVIADFEVRHTFEEIGLRIMILNARRLAQATGAAPLIVLSIEDITGRRKIEEELAEKARMLDLSHDAIIVRDMEGHIRYWNRGAAELYGWSFEEAYGKISHHLLRTEFPSSLEGLTEELYRTDRWFGELRHTRRDGRKITVLVRKPLDRDSEGRPSAVVENISDITARKQAEAALADRVEDLARADRSKDEFLAMLAHELRNPLAPMRNAVEILRADDAGNEERGQARSILARQIGNMTKMINDLLDVSRITEGKIELDLQPVTLEAILTAAASLARSGCAAKGQELRVSQPDSPVVLSADATRLEQVFGNLLNNACKYSGHGTRVNLSAELATGAGPPQVVVRVSDDGDGIAPDLLPHVFDLFRQASRSLDRAHGGLGIGLTLVQRLVNLHGGSVEARSEGLGKGSEFIVRLPVLGTTIPAPVPVALPAGPPERPRRMLIVDDNADAARSLAILQKRRGHETLTVFTGPDAVIAAAVFLPEVVLLDIGLPGMNGFEVARRLREMPVMKNALIVAMSGYGRDEDRAEAKDAGFDDYLVKPVNLARLSEWIRSRA